MTVAVLETEAPLHQLPSRQATGDLSLEHHSWLRQIGWLSFCGWCNLQRLEGLPQGGWHTKLATWECYVVICSQKLCSEMSLLYLQQQLPQNLAQE